MGWRWKLGTFAGIGVYVHATFSLLILWVVLREWARAHDPAATLRAVVFILLLFACVVLHEFGHALTAKRYGILTRDITLLPIGGVARLERMPDDPKQEFWVAIAGPAVNVVLAAILYFGIRAFGAFPSMEQLGSAQAPMVAQLMLVNVALVVFNLIPAFPMDGGRVLRALLATRIEYTRATEMAASIGQAIAFVFGFVGFFYNPFLIFIALFVWIGADQEASMARVKSAFSGIPVRLAMITEFHTLNIGDSLDQAVDLLLSGSQRDFPVVDPNAFDAPGQVVGILTQERLVAALARRADLTVNDAMDRDFRVAHAGDMLDNAFQRMQECKCRVVPVVGLGGLAGLLTADNVGEFLMVQAARKRGTLLSPRGMLGRVP